MLNIALPTGRLGEKAYQCFAAVGYGLLKMEEQNRKLVVWMRKSSSDICW